ncbi:hypothetical protein Tco_0373183 [Tanacetum coccineum]
MADDLTTSIHNLEVCQMQSLHRRCAEAGVFIIAWKGKCYDPTSATYGINQWFVSIGIKASSTFRGSNTRNGGLWSGGLDPKKKGANRDQHSRDQRAQSGDLWSGGLDPDRDANRD